MWQYKDADPEFGQIQAVELQDQLEGVLKDFSVEIFAGKGYVEVRPEGCGKDKAVQHILERYWPQLEEDRIPDSNRPSSQPHRPDVILCIGDDVADEKMFEMLQECYSSNPSEESGIQDTSGINSHLPEVYSVVVGQKPSSAKYYLDDEEDVEALLNLLAKVSGKAKDSKWAADVATISKPIRGLNAESDNIEHTSESKNRERSSTFVAQNSLPEKESVGIAALANKLLNCSSSVPVLTDYFKLKENKVATDSTLQEFLEHIAEDDDPLFF